MCGIVAAVTQRNIINLLLNSIQRLEYRGYDSAGIALINKNNHFIRIRCVGKVHKLIQKTQSKKLFGTIGIAHTRWATHGEVSETNTHPHISSHISIVHNGIIENSLPLRLFLKNQGYIFYSDTDTEVIVHLLHWEQKTTGKSLLQVIYNSLLKLHGNYSMVIMDTYNTSQLIAVCSGSPLVIGIGTKENFIASDQIALLDITKRFIYLKEGDVAVVESEKTKIFNKYHTTVKRNIIESNVKYACVKKGKYKHYMEKEIYEQHISIQNTLKNRLKNNQNIFFSELGLKEINILLHVEHIQIVACGTSYHAAMVAKYWFESLANLPCDVEVASEFNSRKFVIRKKSFFITISQSGETADTLKSLRIAKKLGYLGNLTICNMQGSSLVRESDISLLTKAGIEIGVASTKSFTTQLTVLLMLIVKMISIKKKENNIEKKIVKMLTILPNKIEELLKQNQEIKNIAKKLSNAKNMLFLGRGDQYPIAMEGALKLKEISYIHAEAYPCGELKHGPLALIDKNIPVIILAPKNSLLKKTKQNIQEICTRGGLIYVFSDENINHKKENTTLCKIPYIEEIIAPIFYIIPLQLLAYYIALNKGTNIDQPRNLAKSVTVE